MEAGPKHEEEPSFPSKVTSFWSEAKPR
ncbi:uncharacterized protein METZ01_LOCUS175804, partial [marine metagenome]